MTPDGLMVAAIEVADEGMDAGELPIGAVVAAGDEIIGRAYTQDQALGRRLVHADLLAMIEADQRFGWRRCPQPLRLAVNLEPCLMCLGTAMVLGVTEVYFGLSSPADGGAGMAATWQPGNGTMPWFRAPTMVGGLRTDEIRDQFRRYCATAPESGFRSWAATFVTESGRRATGSRGT